MQREWILELDGPALLEVSRDAAALSFIRGLGFNKILFSGESESPSPVLLSNQLDHLIRMKYRGEEELNLFENCTPYFEVVLSALGVPTPFDKTLDEQCSEFISRAAKAAGKPIFVELPKGVGRFVREEAPLDVTIVERRGELHPFAKRAYAAYRFELAPYRHGRGVWPTFPFGKVFELREAAVDLRVKALIVTVASIPKADSFLGKALLALMGGELSLLDPWEPDLLHIAAEFKEQLVQTEIVDEDVVKALWGLAESQFKLLRRRAKKGGLFAKALPYFERDILRYLLLSAEKAGFRGHVGVPPQGEAPLYGQSSKGVFAKGSILTAHPIGFSDFEEEPLKELLYGANRLLQTRG